MALQHLRSSTADKRPTPGAMSDGQLALNTNLASPGLFFKDSNGDSVKIGPVHVGTTAPNVTPGAGGQAGNSVGEQWLDTTGGVYVFKIYDGTAWRSETGTFVDVNGDTMTGALGIIAGSAAAPGLFFTGDLNTGVFSAGADQLNIATNGVERVEFGTGEVVFNDDGANYDFRIEGDTNANLFFVDASAEAIGIGTASPAPGGQGVHIHNPSAAASSLRVTNSTTGATDGDGFAIQVGSDGTAQLRQFESLALTFETAASEKARLDSSGRLLVGTSSSSADTLFRVQGKQSSSVSNGVVQIARGQTNPTGGNGLGHIQFTDAAGSIGASIIAETDLSWGASDYPSRLLFSTTADGASSPTERMRITSDGDLSMTDGRQIFVSGNGDSPRGKIVLQNASNNTTATLVELRGWNNSVTGTITTRVNVTAYNTSSDYRLKENITDLVDATSRVKLLKPKRFNFKANPDETLDGFLAHEAQIAVPEAVSGQKDQVDDENNPVHQGVDLGKFVPLLTAALQEAIGEIESLKARVAALEAS
jgi:hypothetical protein